MTTIQDRPRVSVVIPLFNGERFIDEAIASLTGQSHPPTEIIVIDDKGTDRGAEMVRSLADENKIIKLFQNEANKGSSFCRNLGIKKSKGDFVLFLDQDDYLGPSFIEEVGLLLQTEREEEASAVHTSYYIVDQGGENPMKVACTEIKPDEFLGYQFERNRILSNSGVVVRKSILRKAGLFDENLKYSQDWDLWLRIGKFGNFYHLGKPLTFIRRHEANTSRRIEGFLEDERDILGKHNLDFIRESVFLRRLSPYENKVSFLGILHRLGEFRKLKDELSSIQVKYPDLSDHRFYAGLLEYCEKRFEEAVQSFGMIIPSSRYYHSARNNLGALLILLGDYRKAIETLAPLTRERPEYQDASKNHELAVEGLSVDHGPIITTRPLREALYCYA